MPAAPDELRKVRFFRNLSLGREVVRRKLGGVGQWSSLWHESDYVRAGMSYGEMQRAKREMTRLEWSVG